MTRVRFGIGALALAAVVAGCGTPQEQCIRAGTRDLRVVERLIAEAQTNLARGYAYETEEITDTRWVVCDYEDRTLPDGTIRHTPRYCLDDVTRSVRKAVAIDPAAEQRKLDGLLARRKALNRDAAATVNGCKAKYPEAV